jgi:hypothetical protein
MARRRAPVASAIDAPAAPESADPRQLTGKQVNREESIEEPSSQASANGDPSARAAADRAPSDRGSSEGQRGPALEPPRDGRVPQSPWTVDRGPTESE